MGIYKNQECPWKSDKVRTQKNTLIKNYVKFVSPVWEHAYIRKSEIVGIAIADTRLRKISVKAELKMSAQCTGHFNVSTCNSSGVPRGGVGWGLGYSNPPPKFRNFDKAEPNSQFHGKYIRTNLIRLWVAPICKLDRTPE
jgi:hypothetical protein